MKIAHISDLHLTGPNFVTDWGEKLIELINFEKPLVVLITGDLTDDGHLYEYQIAKPYIDRISSENKIVLIGNHDARNEGFRTFEQMFSTRYPQYKNDEVIILGIDSTQPDVDDGHIGRTKYSYIRERLSSFGGIKILAMHHHLIPIPATGRERNIPVDTGDVLKLCIDLNVNLVLSGHKHVPWIWRLESIYFITAGTATSRRLVGGYHPSFNVIEIVDDSVAVKEVSVLDGRAKDWLQSKIVMK